MGDSFLRGHGDIQTAVVTLVDSLVPVVPVARQPYLARKIAEVIAGRPSSMGNNMFLRQSIIRGGTATPAHVVDGLATWVTVLFDLGNLRHDRRRALDVKATIPEEALARLAQRAFEVTQRLHPCGSPHGKHRIVRGASQRPRISTSVSSTRSAASQRRPSDGSIKAGAPRAPRRSRSGEGIPAPESRRFFQNGGVVLMVVDVYPSATYKGIRVTSHGAEFNYPPGPARYASPER